VGCLQGRVPGTVRHFDKVHDWVKVACVSVSGSVSAIPGECKRALSLACARHTRYRSKLCQKKRACEAVSYELCGRR